jgi:hypothetical protein
VKYAAYTILGSDTSLTRAETLSDHLQPEPVPQEAVEPLKALALFAVTTEFKPALDGSWDGLEECVDKDLDNKLEPVLKALVSAELQMSESCYSYQNAGHHLSRASPPCNWSKISNVYHFECRPDSPSSTS